MRKTTNTIIALLIVLIIAFGTFAGSIVESLSDVIGEPEQGNTLDTQQDDDVADEVSDTIVYHFRNQKLLNQHYEKHGIDMGFLSPEEYEKSASDVINSPNVLHKTEAEDGDLVYYNEITNEFVVLSNDGYIRTYFLPDSGKQYYDKQ